MITVQAQKWLFGVFLSIGILVMAVAPRAVAGQEGEFNANIDWQKFAGTRLKVAMCSHPAQRILEAMLGEFEALTGMDISFDNYSEDILQQKLQTEMLARSSTYSAFMLYMGNIPEWVPHGWLEDLTPYLNNSKLTDKSWYDLDDFYAPFIKLGRGMDPSMVKPWGSEDKLYGLPLTGEISIVYYRKDLFEKYGIMKPPTAWGEFYDAIEKLTRDDVYGYVGRRRRFHIGCQWPPYLFSWGGRWFDENWDPEIDSPEAIESFEFYHSLEKFASPDIVDFGFSECLANFGEGKAGFWLDMSVGQSSLEDPSFSKVVGKVGYAPCPLGKAGLKSSGWTWLLGMSSAAKDKEAGWYFLQWATSKEVFRKGLMAVGSPRESIINSKEYAESFPKDWVYACSVMLQPSAFVAVPLPLVPKSYEIMDVFGIKVAPVIAGTTTVAEALHEAAEEWRRIIGEYR